jgi:hypothetical protein
MSTAFCRLRDGTQYLTTQEAQKTSAERGAAKSTGPQVVSDGGRLASTRPERSIERRWPLWGQARRWIYPKLPRELAEEKAEKPGSQTSFLTPLWRLHGISQVQ